MKDIALNSLERAREGIKKRVVIAEREVAVSKGAYEKRLEAVRLLRRQLESVEQAVKSLGGTPEDVPYTAVGDEPLIVVLNEALKSSPHTLRQLQEVARQAGDSRHAVRKALTGLAYRHVRKGNEVLYALREANDPVFQ